MAKNHNAKNRSRERDLEENQRGSRYSREEHLLREDSQVEAAPLVSVVIPCYNQARFLGEAIESVLAQSYPHFEVIVVDDGSTDNTSEVAASYAGVRCIRQDNQGLAGARNTGIRESKGSYLVFLDADDCLLPDALKVGVQWLKARPECAFVSGIDRLIAADGSVLQEWPRSPLSFSEEDAYTALLRGNYIAMHATVIYQRDVFETVGGFDTSRSACEDYELYLRVARRLPVCWHNTVVAEYRQHSANMSRSPALILKEARAVLFLQRTYIKSNKRYKEAYKTGVRNWQHRYGIPLAREALAHTRRREWKQALSDLLVLVRYYPIAFVHPKAFVRVWRKLRSCAPPVGRVRFGSLRRLTPVSREFGFDRGLPIDRYYIESFLARQAGDIQGHVLEIKDRTYTRKYGGSSVQVSDVLDMIEDSPQVTIVADLASAPHVPSDTFDCIICTQTLHLIYDVRLVVQTLYRVLKPGGVLLATIPGIG